MLISLLITLAIFGVLVWIILQLPMPQPIRNIIVAVAVIGILLYLLRLFGYGSSLHL